ncbi:hypothetical protein [Bauldia litoralis]|uniref:Uncharacterized protein n=1 Tax=Bauldia litoralis TaxID=665467 RepID=A0A1G6CNU3_9HYPH|nr:hypothetical protein [Bauldia litoralis]SDB34492.1 hypothetical protein SAMN02982931_02549 [Bauldia litoralis]
MRFRSFRTFAAVSSLLMSPAVAFAGDSYCEAFGARLIPNHLYAATCPSARCLVDLTGRGSKPVLKRGASYYFMLALGGDLPPRSAVVIKARYWNMAQPAKKMRSVHISREETDIGCKGESLPRYPSQDEAEVSLRGYDNYHRFGFAGVDDRRKLNRFHFSYDDGTRCVSTNSRQNRRQFLLHSHDYQPGFFGTLAARSGLRSSYALADTNPDYKKIVSYEKISVTLGAYNRRTNISACVGFAAKTTFDGVDLEFVDLNRNLPRSTISAMKTWYVPFAAR